jgi:hypothetical protein
MSVLIPTGHRAYSTLIGGPGKPFLSHISCDMEVARNFFGPLKFLLRSGVPEQSHSK